MVNAVALIDTIAPGSGPNLKGVKQMQNFPKARKAELIVREFADELLVYDKQRHEAHCLNRTAAVIWKYCDGSTSIAEIARRLAHETGESGPVNERLVWQALKQFRRDHLLEERIEIPFQMLAPRKAGANRRQALRALGVTAVIAVPLVTSMVAPTPAQAVSCLGPGSTCTTSAQCCNGSCTSGTCN